MYLKSLEIQGFKSFPDKTLLQFGSDCTAIVGPNGSGKSNISDAISWVLGEQSVKSLRGGSSMSDIIFSGSAQRKAVNLAEVTLVFDNTRRFFMSLMTRWRSPDGCIGRTMKLSISSTRRHAV